MAINQKNSSNLNDDDYFFIVNCDRCDKAAKKCAKDHGAAADNARAEGFITIPGAKSTSPRSWLCMTCKSPQTAINHDPRI